jgi:hypothetical protein
MKRWERGLSRLKGGRLGDSIEHSEEVELKAGEFKRRLGQASLVDVGLLAQPKRGYNHGNLVLVSSLLALVLYLTERGATRVREGA